MAARVTQLVIETLSYTQLAPTAAILSGPSSCVSTVQTAYTVTLNAVALSTVTITPASTDGGDTFQATVGGGNVSTITIATGASQNTFYVTTSSTSFGSRNISITTSPAYTYTGSPIALNSNPSLALSGPSSG